jgi:hypothetical protein
VQLHHTAQSHTPHLAALRHGSCPSGLKTTQRAILAQIGRSEPTTVGELAGALVMDSGALAHTLKPLDSRLAGAGFFLRAVRGCRSAPVGGRYAAAVLPFFENALNPREFLRICPFRPESLIRSIKLEF